MDEREGEKSFPSSWRNECYSPSQMDTYCRTHVRLGGYAVLLNTLRLGAVRWQRKRETARERGRRFRRESMPDTPEAPWDQTDGVMEYPSSPVSFSSDTVFPRRLTSPCNKARGSPRGPRDDAISRPVNNRRRRRHRRAALFPLRVDDSRETRRECTRILCTRVRKKDLIENFDARSRERERERVRHTLVHAFVLANFSGEEMGKLARGTRAKNHGNDPEIARRLIDCTNRVLYVIGIKRAKCFTRLFIIIRFSNVLTYISL